jgi:hypothetical protein
VPLLDTAPIVPALAMPVLPPITLPLLDSVSIVPPLSIPLMLPLMVPLLDSVTIVPAFEIALLMVLATVPPWLIVRLLPSHDQLAPPEAGTPGATGVPPTVIKALANAVPDPAANATDVASACIASLLPTRRRPVVLDGLPCARASSDTTWNAPRLALHTMRYT